MSTFETVSLPIDGKILVVTPTNPVSPTVAKAHLFAYQSPAAANQQYLITAHGFSYQWFCDIIRARFPELAATTLEGNSNEPLPDVYRLDNSKAENQLRMEWRPMEETIVDTVNSLREFEKSLQ